MREINSFLFIIIIFIFSSCFEIVEEVNLDEAGGGDFKLTVNLSKSKGQVKNLLALDTLRGRNVPSIEEIGIEIDKIVRELEEVEGVSEVSSVKNFDDFILSISYHFNDINTLNRSIQYVVENHTNNRPDLTQITFYNYQDNVFERKVDFDYSIIMKNFRSDLKILETSTYTSIYRFKVPVDYVSNSSTKVSKSGKAVMNKVRASQLIKDQSLIKNKIKLK